MKFKQGIFAAKLLALLTVFAATAAMGLLQASPNVPNGFQVTPVVYPLAQVTDMAIAPDGRLFVTQKTGPIGIVKNGTLLPKAFATVSVDQTQERGLDGITLDPNFATNGYVYVYYTATTPVVHNRVSRFTANGDVAVPGSETVLLDLDPLGASGFHNGSSVRFGPDGKLYIGVGDNNQNGPAQSMTTLLGKILRINSDGTIPTDNPFYNTATGVYRAIWALGVRNPFKINFQPGTGRLFIHDVGSDWWEEINDGIAGSNYGWPVYEGYSNNPNYRSPLFAYPHSDNVGSNYPGLAGCAITGGAFYNPATQSFPSNYVGKYFFADYCGGWIGILDPSTNSTTTFASGFTELVHLVVADDGSMYLLEIADATGGWGTGGIYQLKYTGVLSPQIGTQPSNTTVPSGSPATFSVTAFGDQPLTYQWQRDGVNVGTNSSSYTLQPTTLADSGAHFHCVVSNSFGTTTSNDATLTVISDQPPVPNITQPLQSGSNQNVDGSPYSPLAPADQLYAAGDTINFAGTATDPEDGTLPASTYMWQVDFHHHFTTDAHIHPFISAFSGVTSGSFVIPATGETNDDVWYRILLMVTDSSGVSTTTYRDVMPRKSTFTLATNPAGLQLTLDGQYYNAPLSVLGVVNLQRTIGAPSLQTVSGTTYSFVSWSDNGAATHTIATPATDTTFTATYRAVPQTANGNASVFVSQSVPTTMNAGLTYNASITLTNAGSTTWTPGVHRLGSQNPRDNRTWGLNRADFSQSIAPGQSATFNFAVTAPLTPGTYNFQWQMLQEGVEWFGDVTPNVAVNVVQNNAAFVSQSVPTKMAAGQSYSVSVTMQNNGTTTWTPSQNFKLGSANPSDNSTWGLSRVLLSGPVAPGQTATFNFAVTAPLTPGTYNFQWQMLQSGVQWFGAPTANVQITVGTQPADGAAFYFQNVPTTMVAGQTYGIQIIMKNSGTATWSEADRYRMGSQNPSDNTTWGLNRLYLSSSIAPGQSATFNFAVTAPLTPGTYNFQWQMVHDRVAWFGNPTPNVAVTVTANPNSAKFVSQTVPVSMAPGQSTSVTVRMQNTGTTTWSAGNNYYLGSQNPQDNTRWGFNRVALASSVVPGDTATFTFNVTAPVAAGNYSFQWRMVQDGVGWFGDWTPNTVVSVSNPAVFVSQTVPTTMTHGQSYNVSITMRNTSSATWTSAANYKLGSQNPQDNTTWGFNRVLLPNSVSPGSNVTFNFTVKAPPTPGSYNFQWRMLQTGVSWFGDFTPNVVVNVQ